MQGYESPFFPFLLTSKRLNPRGITLHNTQSRISVRLQSRIRRGFMLRIRGGPAENLITQSVEILPDSLKRVVSVKTCQHCQYVVVFRIYYQ
jgi:hypothetical protein